MAGLYWSHVGTQEGEGIEKRGEPRVTARRPQIQREQVTKMVGLYREGQPSPCTGDV